MTTKEAEAIIELAARYWRNQWKPGTGSRESRETILEAARVLLDSQKRPVMSREFGSTLSDNRVHLAVVDGCLEVTFDGHDTTWGEALSQADTRELVAMLAARVLPDGEGGGKLAEVTERAEKAERERDGDEVRLTRDEQVELVASELALIDGYNPNDHPSEVWAAIATGYRKRAERIVDVVARPRFSAR